MAENKIKLPIKRIAAALMLLAMFVMFTVTVRVFDVNAEGAGNHTAIGFYELNDMFYRATGIFGHLAAWRILGECLNAVAVGVAIAMACLCVWQMVKGKSAKASDRYLWLTCAAYADLVLVHGLFRILKLNFGPSIVGELIVPSYPSIHSLTAFVVFGTAIPLVRRYITEPELGKVLVFVFKLLRLAVIVLSLISGVEWLTDVVGALLLGASMITLYYAGIDIIGAQEKDENKTDTD